jgi:hypothetical protein
VNHIAKPGNMVSALANKSKLLQIPLKNLTYKQRIERDILAYSRTGGKWCCLENPLEPFCANHAWH